MARARGIRAQAFEADIPLSNQQLKQFRAYGLLPDREEGESDPRDVDRLRQILAAKDKAQSLDRRLFYLHDPNWPIPADCIRNAVREVAQKIRTPDKQNRALYRCLQMKSQITHGSKPQKTIPSSWKLPPKDEWRRILSWPGDEDFKAIYEWCRSEIIALAYVPGMRDTEDFQTSPFEEMVVLMMLHQLSLPPQTMHRESKELDPWP